MFCVTIKAPSLKRESKMESVRLLYVSKIARVDSGLKQNLINILDEAIDFNYRNGVTGVLYYGHGYFVQCLEGNKNIIDDLYEFFMSALYHLYILYWFVFGNLFVIYKC